MIVAILRLLSVCFLFLYSIKVQACAEDKRWAGFYTGIAGLSQEIEDDRLDGFGVYLGWSSHSSQPTSILVFSHEVGLGIDDTESSTVLWTSSTLGWDRGSFVTFIDLGFSLYSLYGFPVGSSIDFGAGVEIPVNPSISIRAEYSRGIIDDHEEVSVGRAGLGITARF